MFRVFFFFNTGKDNKGFFPYFFIFCFIFIWPSLSYSVRVKRISIKGNKIVEGSLIRSHIQLKKGSVYSERTIQKDVRKLFSLGFFDDIEVHSFPFKNGRHIVYQMKERIPIAKVEFQGNENLNTEDLQELSLIKEYGFLDFGSLQETLSAIKQKYKEQGYYTAEVSYETKKIAKEQKFQLIIKIQENTKLFIKKIRFIGNRSIPSRQLKAFLLNKERNIFSFLGSSGFFQAKNIDRDLQFLEYYYRDKGYLGVKVHQPEITITPDKKFLYISFFISEGPRFKIGQVDFRGDDVVSIEKVEAHLKLGKEEYFSLGRLQEDIRFISLLYKNKGYAFVEVQPQFFPDSTEEDKIHILFNVKKGKAYKLGRIHLFGNNSSRDKVILRRFHIKEGDFYNESQKELSRQLIQQLGYFEEVDFRLTPSERSKEELDLIVRVKERENTGEAHVAGGYNSQTKLFIQGGIKKQNFLGLDQNISLNLNFNRYAEIFAFSYQNPYLLDSHWNFSFDLFNTGQNTLSGSSSSSLFSQSYDYFSYFQLNTGFSLSLGRHLTGFSTIFLRYKLQNQSLSNKPIYYLRSLPVLSPIFQFLFGGQTDDEIQQVVFSDIYDLKSASGLNSSLSAILEYDKRNDRYYASKGFFLNLSAEYAGLGGDFDHTKLQGSFRHYYSPFWKLVVKNRLDYAFIFSNDEKKPVVFSELFVLGGPYNLRGFQINSQGPRKRSQKAYDYAKQHNDSIEEAKRLLPEQQARLEKLEMELNETPNLPSDLVSAKKEEIQAVKNQLSQYKLKSSEQAFKNPETFAYRPYGGTQMFFYSLELEFPIIEKAELRGAFFFDIGEANEKILFDLNDQLRMDVGLGLRWKSPFGPISLDWAFPYKPREKFDEQAWEFQFSLGSQF